MRYTIYELNNHNDDIEIESFNTIAEAQDYLNTLNAREYEFKCRYNESPAEFYIMEEN